jgi:hypothetical protein
MSKKKPSPSGRAKKKAEVSLVRSSAAEYLTFVAAGGDSEASVEMRYEDENVWLTHEGDIGIKKTQICPNQAEIARKSGLPGAGVLNWRV